MQHRIPNDSQMPNGDRAVTQRSRLRCRSRRKGAGERSEFGD
jgi:hypothetical protein